MLTLARAHLDLILSDARAAAPVECCGILAGACEAGVARVHEVHRAPNVAEGDRTRRYLLDPRTHLRVQRDCRARGLEIVGFYHSHPDGRAVPSAADAEMAWPGAVYLIVAAPEAEPPEVRAWQLSKGGAFEEVSLRVEDA